MNTCLVQRKLRSHLGIAAQVIYYGSTGLFIQTKEKNQKEGEKKEKKKSLAIGIAKN